MAIPSDRAYEDLTLPTIEQIAGASVSFYQGKLKPHTIGAEYVLPTLQSGTPVTSGLLFRKDPTGGAEILNVYA